MVSGPVAPLGFLRASLLGSNRPSALAPSAASAGATTLCASLSYPRGCVTVALFDWLPWFLAGARRAGDKLRCPSDTYTSSPEALQQALRVAGKDELPGCQKAQNRC